MQTAQLLKNQIVDEIGRAQFRPCQIRVGLHIGQTHGFTQIEIANQDGRFAN